MLYYDYFETVSKASYERLCDELSEVSENNKRLEMQVEYLKLENERLLAIISNFNNALEIMGGVK